jgi:hypothetical protein
MKPMVVVILEQDAMDLLTRPSGAKEAWAELSLFEGKELTPSLENTRPMRLQDVQKIFEILASINFCLCRPLDLQHESQDRVLARTLQFVKIELPYQKAHSLLQVTTKYPCTVTRSVFTAIGLLDV